MINIPSSWWSWWCWRKCSSCRWRWMIKGSNKGSPGLCPPLPRRLPPPPAAYIALHCTPTLVTQRNRAQTAPPDCSQTRLKNDQKTTPTSDPVYLSEKPLLHIRVAKRHSSYTDNKLSLIFDPKKPVICNWYILATNPINPGQSKSFSFGLLHSSSNLISS